MLAVKDLGVANWPDTGGLPDGMITIRWEGLPPNVDIPHAAKGVTVVPIAQLAASLPGAPHIGAKERREILPQLQAGFAQRTEVE